MRLAYADPPYPGKAHLYPENTEVDHVELIAQLCEYDGWALSTDEVNLAYVLALCPPRTRVLAWCKSDAMPYPPNPWASWEPVLLWPARSAGATVRSYFVGPGPPKGFLGNGGSLVGAKTAGFCEWVIRSLGGERGDTLVDVFPGTGIMGATWDSFQRQPPLWCPSKEFYGGRHNKLRRTNDQLPGMPEPVVHAERRS